MKIDTRTVDQYCEHCGQTTKLSPASQRSETIEKICLVSALFLAGMFVGVMLL